MIDYMGCVTLLCNFNGNEIDFNKSKIIIFEVESIWAIILNRLWKKIGRNEYIYFFLHRANYMALKLNGKHFNGGHENSEITHRSPYN